METSERKDDLSFGAAIEPLFEPVWAGGWELTRWLVILAGILTHGLRYPWIEDAYAAPDMVFTSGMYAVHAMMDYGPFEAKVTWLIGMVGLLFIGLGGRLFRLGVVLFLLGDWTLLAAEALNIKAYDRLLFWVMLGVLFSPLDERDLTRKYRSPFARNVMLLGYMAIYFSTGVTKLVHNGDEWFNGTALAYAMVHLEHGMSPMGVFISSQRWMTAIMGIITVAWEVLWPFFILFRRTNALLLGVGFLFHLSLLLMMDVGPFFFIAVSGYPVLLHPELARELWERWKGR